MVIGGRRGLLLIRMLELGNNGGGFVIGFWRRRGGSLIRSPLVLGRDGVGRAESIRIRNSAMVRRSWDHHK